MIASVQNKTPFSDAFRAGREQLPGEAWMRALRDSAIGNFEEQGIPTRKDEEWRYLDLKSMGKTQYRSPSAKPQVDEALAKAYFLDGTLARFCFVDGRYDANLSQVDDLPAGVELLSVAEAMSKNESELKNALEDSAVDSSHPFVALNTAFLRDGYVLCLKKGVQLEKPVQILFVGSQALENCAEHPRHFLFLAEEAKAEVIECYVSPNAGNFLNNVVSEIALEKGARLSLCRVQSEGSACSHLNYSKVNVGQSAHFESKVFSFGAKTSRNEIEIQLSGTHAFCSLEGLYIGGGDQCLDNRTVIDHQVSDGTSREFYKGILGGKARGAFSGKILVEEGAQRTDSEQNNRNLLLSDDAEADSKPQLEIYADDVKCSHGATVGQLDEDQIFYLRARGIGEAQARSLLTAAFAMDLVDSVGNENIRAFLENQVSEKLSQEVGQ